MQARDGMPKDAIPCGKALLLIRTPSASLGSFLFSLLAPDIPGPRLAARLARDLQPKPQASIDRPSLQMTRAQAGRVSLFW